MAKPTVQEVAHRALGSPANKKTSSNELMPYCLHTAEDYFKGDASKIGHFLLVNRNYDPLSATIAGEDPIVAATSLVVLRPQGQKNFYLYDDRCVPQQAKFYRECYDSHLKVLCGLLT